MANRTLAYVHRFFNWAARRDLIEANPAQFVEKPGAEVRRDRVLDDGELVEVWRAVEGMPEPFAAGVRLLILTGARRSEIFEASARRAGAGSDPAAGRALQDRRRPAHPSVGPCPAIVDALPVFANSRWLLTLDGKHPFANFGSRLTQSAVTHLSPAMPGGSGSGL